MKINLQTPYFRGISALFLFLFTSNILHSQGNYYPTKNNSNPFFVGGANESRTFISLSGQWNVKNGGLEKTVNIPGGYNFEEIVTFTKNFNVDENEIGKNSFRIFSYGINHRAEFFVNDIFIGRHDGGYLPFSILIKDNILQPGNGNYLKIIVDNELDSYSTIPLEQQVGGWKNYGGIVRDIFIIKSTRIFFENIKVSSIDISKLNAQISLDANFYGQEINDSTENISVSYEIKNLQTGEVVGKSSSQFFKPLLNREVLQNFKVNISNPMLWSPISPNRYIVKLKIQNSKNEILDEVNYNFGIRSLSVEKNKFLINQQNYFINGVNWIEGSLNSRASLNYEEMEKDVATIKSLGANAIKFVFHPPHPFMIEMCDKYGIMAFIDIPFYEIPEKQIKSKNFQIKIEEYLFETLKISNTNPSVVAVGIFNEVQVTKNNYEFLNKLFDFAKTEKNIVSYFTTKLNNEFIKKINSDLVFVNPVLSDENDFQNSLQQFKTDFKNKPIYVGKIGMEVEVGNHNGYSDPVSYEKQAKYFYQSYYKIEKNNYNGGFVWAYNDFESDQPSFATPSKNYFIRTFGLVEFWKDERISFDAVRTIFLKEKPIALEVGNYSISTPVSFVVIGLIALIIITFYFNASRNFRNNLTRSLFRPYNFFVDVRDYRTLPFLQTTILALLISASTSIIFTSILIKIKSSDTLDYLFTSFFKNINFKLFFISIINNSFLGVLYFIGIILIILIINTFILQIVAFLARKKLYFFHAYSIIVWGALPMIIFIPIGMILFRIIDSDFYFNLILLMLLLTFVWIYFRSIKGFSIVYSTPYLKVISISLISTIAIILSIIIYVNEKFAFFSYLDFYFTTIK